MIITTDDLCPANLEGQFNYWDELNERNPNIKLTAFTTANWKFTRVGRNFDNNSILNSDFIDFCNDRRSWMNIAFHGLTHLEIMNKLSLNEQISILNEMLDIFNGFKKEYKGNVINAYKAPFYRWNSDTIKACLTCGIDFIFVQDGILDIKNYYLFKRGDIGLIDSHTNPECPMPDRIDLIKDSIESLIPK